MQPGSEATIYSHYFECISVIFPVTFPVTFHFGPYNPDTSVGSIQDFRFPEICRLSLVPRFQRSVPGWSRGQTQPSRSITDSKGDRLKSNVDDGLEERMEALIVYS